MYRLFLILMLFSSLIGRSEDSDIDKIFQQMEEKMNRMMEGFGPDPFSADDALIDHFFSDSFGAPQSDLHISWSQDDKHRIMIIKPEATDHNLKVNIQGDSIEVKGTLEKKEEQKGENFHSSSKIYSSVQQSFPIPNDCTEKGSEVKNVDGELRVYLPYKNGRPGNPGMLYSTPSFPDRKAFPSRKLKRPADPEPKKQDSPESEDDDMIPLFRESNNPGDVI
ncbi:MAG: Hsp20/alpha crystallin family protein [Halobacteriovoraceae bacterium]|nr:Hsp20/alpha crystallin family protein [Halobacteriovoraceae bacterium]MCB9095405.1 Hsp20/alpha crystallin family protein [Halobacteriovoraceae bacterium]